MLTSIPTNSGCDAQRGSVLLEGLVAIVIFSLGILGLVGLQASSMKATTGAKGRVDASLVANQRIASMWVDRNNLSAYNETDTAVAGLPNGKRTTQVVGTTVTVTISWRMPGDLVANTYKTVANIAGN